MIRDNVMVFFVCPRCGALKIEIPVEEDQPDHIMVIEVDPPNVQQLVASLMEVLAHILANPPSDDEACTHEWKQ